MDVFESWYPRPVLFPFICTTYNLMQTITVPYVSAVHNQASHLWYPFGYHSYLQSLYVQTDGVILIVTRIGDVMVIHCTWCTPKVTLPLGVQCRTVTYCIGVCKGHGVYTGILIWAVTQISVCERGYSNYRSKSIRNYPPTQDMGHSSCKFDCFSGRHVLRS